MVETAKVLARDARRVVRGDRRARPRTISSGCSPRCRARRALAHPPCAHDAAMTLHHPRLRLVRRRAAAGARLGRLRSATTRRTAAGAPRCWSSAAKAPRRHPRPDRHLARPARAAARSPRSTGSTACSTPMSTPTIPTASTICARCSCTSAAARRRLSRRARPRAHARPLRLLLRDAARQRISADRERAPAGGRPSRSTIEGQGGPIHGPADPAGARRHPVARLPLRRLRLFLRPQRPAGRERGGAGRASMSGSSMRCATSRIRAISASPRRWPGSSGSSRGARS